VDCPVLAGDRFEQRRLIRHQQRLGDVRAFAHDQSAARQAR